MKTVHGKKFCEQCNSHVFDVRKKTAEQIVDLKKNKGACCVIIYEDQLQQAELLLLQEKIRQKRKAPFLPMAASLAALSLIPQLSWPQAHNNTETIQPENTARNKEGKENTALSAPGKKDEQKIITIIGFVRRSTNKIGKKHHFDLGYYDRELGFVLVKKFSSRANGHFRIRLTQEEYQLLSRQQLDINCGSKRVNWKEFNITDRSAPLVIDVLKRIRAVGKF